MSSAVSPRRPALRYFGGKWRLAPWVISLFPPHRVYVEPFGGAASVLLRKGRSYCEVYNELDGEIVNLFQVLRDEAPALIRAIELTPFSRTDYQSSFKRSKNKVEQARRTLVRSFMGFGSNSLCHTVKSGFRANANRSGTTAAGDWRNLPLAMVAIVERWRGVVIENREAVACMEQHDSEETLFYVDPPYVHSTRSKWAGNGARKGYNFEMSDAQHRALALKLHSLQGNVILSGYPSPLYDELFADWKRLECPAFADGARARVEVVWMNFNDGGLLF